MLERMTQSALIAHYELQRKATDAELATITNKEHAAAFAAMAQDAEPAEKPTAADIGMRALQIRAAKGHQ